MAAASTAEDGFVGDYILGGAGIHGDGGILIASKLLTINAPISMENHQIHNLAPATAGTDAVNLNQVQAMTSGGNSVVWVGEAVAGIGSQLTGFGNALNELGSQVGGLNVAVNSLNGRVEDLNGTVNGHTLQLADHTAQLNYLQPIVVKYDDPVSKDKITLGGADGTTIANLKNGTLSHTSSEAITGAQLNAIVNESDGIKYFHSNSLAADSKATGANALAVGPMAVAAGANGLAVGQGSSAAGNASSTLGAYSKATGLSASALGEHAQATGRETTAVGTFANATQAFDTALGGGATASGGSSLAVGYQAMAVGEDSVGIGRGSSATGSQTIAIGSDSVADRDRTVSVGNSSMQRQIVNVAAGTADTDAVNVKQLRDVGLPVNGGTFVAYNDSTKAQITLSGVSGTVITNVAAGAVSATSTDAVNGSQLNTTNTSLANVTDAVNDIKSGLGSGSKFFHANSMLADSSATGGDSIAVGPAATASGTQSTAIGVGTVASDDYAVALGDHAKASGPGALALGTTSSAAGKHGTAVGLSASATAEDSTALGAYSVADRANTVSVGSATQQRQIVNVAKGSQDTDAVNVAQLKSAGLKTDVSGNVSNAFIAYDDVNQNLVTLQGKSGSTKITKLAAGAVSATSSDAINGSQLYASALSTSKALGGNAGGVNSDGTIKAPTYTVGNTDYDNVGAALAATATLIGTGSKADPDVVRYDTSDHTSVTLGGTSAKDPVVLTNVANGKAATDAVNFSQLKSLGLATDSSGNVTNSFVAYNDASKGLITLAGGAGTTITNLKAGAINASSTDAVNGAQLHAAAVNTAAIIGGNATVNGSGQISQPTFKVGDDVYHDVSSAIEAAGKVGGGTGVSDPDVVRYVDATHGTVAFDGTAGTRLSNVAKGKTALDAVNLGQLTAAGLTTDSNGNATNSFVSYDAGGKSSVTLAGGTNGVKIANVATGVADRDAVNVKQLSDAVSNVSTSTASLNYVRFGSPTGLAGQASGTNSIAVGSGSYATADGALAIGSGARATGINSVALGIGSSTSEDDTVSIGSTFMKRRIVNVAEGTSDTDAVNLGQVNDLIASKVGASPVSTQSVAMQRSLVVPLAAVVSSMTPDQLLASGPTDKVNAIEALGSDSIAIGLNVHANGPKAVAIGTNTSSTGLNSVAVGASAIAGADETTVVGVRANSIATRGVAVGTGATVEQVDGISIGTNTQIGGAGQTQAIAIGTGTIIAAANSVSLGNTNTISAAGTFVLGNNTNASAANSIAIGGTNTVTAAGANSILVGSNSRVSAAGSTAIGGSNTVTAAGTFVLGSGVSAKGANSVVLGAGSDGSLSNVVSVGAAGTERRIVNVKTGTADTDAVNLAQLKAVTGSSSANSVSYDDSTLGSITLKGTSGSKIANVANGTANMDAVNLSQLKAAGGARHWI